VYDCGGTIRSPLPGRSRGLTYPPRVFRPTCPPGSVVVAVSRRRLRLVRGLVILVLSSAILLPGATPAVATPPAWIQDIDTAIAGHDVSVAIGLDGSWLLRRAAWVRRAAASNQKLVLSMALLQRRSPTSWVRTQVFAKGATVNGVLRGNLWIVGRGDPTVRKPTMAALARAVRAAGIRRVRGRVMGSTAGFQRDWWAPGWRDYFPDEYIPLPTALTFEGNQVAGTHIRDPERRAARSLTTKLRALGVPVGNEAGAGRPPTNLRPVASVRSPSFGALLRRMNRESRNFHAEVLGKWLGRLVFGGAGTIAKGARAIERFTEARGLEVVANDASGLSYANRVSARDLVRLLWFAESRPWGGALRAGLAGGDQGTLEDRLLGVRVRAKTGTLIGISALSGWVWLEREGRWGEFSILSRGMSKSQAVAIEDRIVRIVANRAAAAATQGFPQADAGSMLPV
jgi:D-alanyl-D-alanine carboxypeptidase/D-alanyl-D-alanine-endopeptidase (penicillin-binding protein 4)